MRGGYAAIGLILASSGFLIFARTLFGFNVATAPLFAVAAIAALVAAGGIRTGRSTWVAAGAALLAATFLWLQLTRPSFALTLGTTGNLLIAAGATTTAVTSYRAPTGRGPATGWAISALGGLAFLPGNLAAGGAFLGAGLLATTGFALASLPLLTPAQSTQDPVPE